jgi:hypothetical protein
MAARLGAGVDIVTAGDGVEGARPIADLEMRWGFRPGLELSLPLALTASTTTRLGLTYAGVGLQGLFPSPTLSFAAGHVLTLGDTLAVVAQARITDPTGVGGRRGNLGLALRPHDAIILTPGAALLDGKESDVVVLGAALERGMHAAPLVELEIVDGLFLYESSAAYFRSQAGLTPLGHSHVLGLAFYF